VIEAPGGTAAIKAAARSAANKHGQIHGKLPTVVWVKFGQTVDVRQASEPLVRVGVIQEVQSSLIERNAHRVSGVVWVFTCTVLFPPTGHRFVVREPGSNSSSDKPTFVWFWIPNPVADRPVSLTSIIPSLS
jgi:hypothetical protein